MIAQGYPLQATEYVPDEDRPEAVRAGDVFFVVGWVETNPSEFRPVLVPAEITEGATAFVADPERLYEIEET
jgi:hypothetical protein